MGDMGELFNDRKKVKQEKRASNRKSSAQLLRDASIRFDEKNMGAHLIVVGRYDFWPGTGLWIDRATNKRKRGVRKLITAIVESGCLSEK